MRGLDTNVKRIRRKVFKEIAKVGFQSSDETLVADICLLYTSTVSTFGKAGRNS